ncbi:MAG: PilZ domain-containing protein [Halothiobacillaceae bacterium]
MTDLQDERRLYLRKRLEGDVLLRRHSAPDRLLRGQVIDIGAEGLCLQTDEAINSNEPLELTVRVRDPAGAFHLKGRQSWCRADGPRFRVGIELDGADSSDDWTDWRALFID